MRVQLSSFAGILALGISSAVIAQARPPAAPAQPSTPPSSPSATAPGQMQSMPAQPSTPPSSPSATAPGQTQSTPGQMQTTPGEASTMTPAQTGQTPSGQSIPNAGASQAQSKPLATATLRDAKAGEAVFDQKGGTVGKIVSATAKGVIVDTGTVKATIPLSSFGKSDKGLVLSMTKEEIDAAAKKKSGK
jgi:hypothetical protein